MKIISSIFIYILFTSCSIIYSSFFGVRVIRKLDKNRCEKVLSGIQYKGLSHHSYYADSSQFRSFRALPPSKIGEKSFSQPIQILYFQNDTLASYHANCYAKGGLGKLDWNVSGRFDKYIPASALHIDSVRITWSDVRGKFPMLAPSNNKKIIFIMWSSMLERASVEAIQYVIDNVVDKDSTNTSEIIILNNDLSFISR